MSVVFDKLSFMRNLESDGIFPRPQAERLSDTIHQAFQEAVATKTDIERLELRIDGMEAKLDARLSAFEAKIDGKLAVMDSKFTAMDSKFTAVDTKFTAMDTKLTSMEARLEARVDAALASLKVWFAGGLVALFSALSAIRFFAH